MDLTNEVMAKRVNFGFVEEQVENFVLLLEDDMLFEILLSYLDVLSKLLQHFNLYDV